METPNQSDCRKCGKPIYWHKSKGGKNYPCDSPTDRRAFHQCEGEQQSAAPPPLAQTPKPITSNIEASLEERVGSLERQVAQLTRTVQAVHAGQPIEGSDVGF